LVFPGCANRGRSGENGDGTHKPTRKEAPAEDVPPGNGWMPCGAARPAHHSDRAGRAVHNFRETGLTL